MRKIFPYLILLVALLISGTSGYYSIIGLTKLFAGAVTEVAILGIVLELAKIVITTSLQRYWTLLSVSIRIYLISAIAILMLITSAGIYGFLSSAYQNTIITDTVATKVETAVDNRIDRYSTLKNELALEYSTISKNINDLQQSGVDYTDKYYSDAIRKRDKISIKIDRVNDSIEKYDSKKLAGYTDNSHKTTELSSLKYISKLTGVDMDRILNYFLLLIIFVFDPLALAMLLVYNSIQLKLNTLKDVQPVIKVDDPPPNVDNSENENSVDPITEPEKVFQEKSESAINLESRRQPNNSKEPISTKRKKKSVKQKETVQIREDDVGDNILTPEQIKNMSHQTMHKILSERKKT